MNDSLGILLIKSLVEMNLNGILKIENNNGTLVQIEWEE
jgi:two-component sensor histidine kinase